MGLENKADRMVRQFNESRQGSASFPEQEAKWISEQLAAVVERLDALTEANLMPEFGVEPNRIASARKSIENAMLQLKGLK